MGPDVGAPYAAVHPVGHVAAVRRHPGELLVAAPGRVHGVHVVVGRRVERDARGPCGLDAAVPRAGDGVEVVRLLGHRDDVVVEHVAVLVRHAPSVHARSREERRRRALGHVEVASVGVHGRGVRHRAGERGVHARGGDGVGAARLRGVEAVEGPVELEAVLDRPVRPLDVGDGVLLGRDARVGALHGRGADGELGVSVVAHLEHRHVRGLAGADARRVGADVLNVCPEALGVGGVVLVVGVRPQARARDGLGVDGVDRLDAHARRVVRGVVAHVEHGAVGLAREVHGDAVLAVDELRRLGEVQGGVVRRVGEADLAPGDRELRGVLGLDVHRDLVDPAGLQVEARGVEVVELVPLLGPARLGARVAQLGELPDRGGERVAVPLEVRRVAPRPVELLQAEPPLRGVDAGEVGLDLLAQGVEGARRGELRAHLEGEVVREGVLEQVEGGGHLGGGQRDAARVGRVDADRRRARAFPRGGRRGGRGPRGRPRGRRFPRRGRRRPTSRRAPPRRGRLRSAPRGRRRRRGSPRARGSRGRRPRGGRGSRSRARRRRRRAPRRCCWAGCRRRPRRSGRTTRRRARAPRRRRRRWRRCPRWRRRSC